MVLHIVPRGFWIDGTEPVADPVGLYAHRLDAEVHIVTGALSAIQNLAKCVEGAGVQLDDMILAPLAAATTVLDAQERRQGVAVVDIGAGTTSIAVFADGAIAHSAVIPIAGNHLTQDLASVLRCPWDTAEQVKRRHGAALVAPANANTRIEVEVFGSRSAAQVSLSHIAEILRARCEEIVDMIGAELRKAGYLDEIAAGLVLCGGTSELPGLSKVTEDRLSIPVRSGAPRAGAGLTELLHSPAHATSLGLLTHALGGSAPREPLPMARPAMDAPFDGVIRRMKAMVRALVP
jgi:cell division protein FtsA